MRGRFHVSSVDDFRCRFRIRTMTLTARNCFLVLACSLFPVVANGEPMTSINDPGVLLFKAIGHTGSASSVDFSFDGRSLASSGSNGIKIWSLAGGALPKPIGDSAFTEYVAFLPDATRLFSLAGGDIRVRDPNLGTLQQEISYSQNLHLATFLGDGKSYIGWPGNEIIIWETDSGKEVRRFGMISVNAITSDNKGELIAIAQGKNVLLHNADGSFLLRLTGHLGTVSAVAISPDGRFLASGDDKGSVRLWDLKRNGQPERVLSGHTAHIRSICFTMTSDKLFTTSYSPEGVIKAWSVNSNDPIHTITDLPEWPLAGALSPSEELLAVAASDGSVTVIWNPIFESTGDSPGRVTQQTVSGRLRIEWGGFAGARFQLQQTLSLTTSDWENLGMPLIQSVTTLDIDKPARFFRVIRIAE